MIETVNMLLYGFRNSPAVSGLRIGLIGLGAVTLAGCMGNVKGTIDQVKSALTPAPTQSLLDIDAESVPDAEPRQEALSERGNPSSYKQNGRTYNVLRSAQGHREQGMAQVYPTNYHGNRTANGEVYDMFAMTAGHKSLPLPSYARVTHTRSGKSIVVRINDRGPFAPPGVIELSGVAAAKLGILRSRTAEVEIEGLVGGQAGNGSIAPADQPVTRPLQRWTPPQDGESLPPAQPVEPIRQTNPSREIRPLVEPRETPAPAAPRYAAPPPPVQPATPPSAPVAAGFDLQAGAFQNRENADRLVQRLRNAGITPARVIVEPSGAVNLYKVRIGPYANRRDAEQAAAVIRSRGIASPRVVVP